MAVRTDRRVGALLGLAPAIEGAGVVAPSDDEVREHGLDAPEFACANGSTIAA